MPVGIMTDVTATAMGAIAGCIIGSRLSDSWKDLLNNIMGIAALFMGITLMLRANNLQRIFFFTNTVIPANFQHFFPNLIRT